MEILRTASFEVAANLEGDRDAFRLALLLPGRLDTKDYINFVSHAEYLSKLGYLAVAIDMPGTWQSPGDIADYTTSQHIQVVHELMDLFGNRPSTLLGHSRGGATAVLCSDNPAVESLVLINTVYRPPKLPEPDYFKNETILDARDLPPGDICSAEQAALMFTTPAGYFVDGARYDPAAALQRFDGHVLIAHSVFDEFQPIDTVRAIYGGLTGRSKSFLQLSGTHDYRLYPEAINKVNSALDSLAAYRTRSADLSYA